MTTEDKDQDVYLVVANAEEQYSIWAADLPLPGGWRLAGKRGSKSECLEHIKEVWTDMRPLSLQQRLQA
ncbi:MULTISPECIES: MbtH family protein [Pseudomonas]|jgi:MbtH protein|uniref:MbtH family NRPS accessory protein n=1 Tax=Pseudomonas gingeri TaxID=117681 RepID=A0A7Y7WKF1_9PSED|nr:MULTISPECIES: MbtH family NRPS accessory protein [Pseudomonas]MCU1739643.1 MbtH family NRPS accessory protein [Pseudomonas sp. 20S_6.2_Bac1]NWB51127.1 MbtH family NRPS accessory protein [Pseudomonas gingeri]